MDVVTSQDTDHWIFRFSGNHLPLRLLWLLKCCSVFVCTDAEEERDEGALIETEHGTGMSSVDYSHHGEQYETENYDQGVEQNEVRVSIVLILSKVYDKFICPYQ